MPITTRCFYNPPVQPAAYTVRDGFPVEKKNTDRSVRENSLEKSKKTKNFLAYRAKKGKFKSIHE